jgi:hypothetical protein
MEPTTLALGGLGLFAAWYGAYCLAKSEKARRDLIVIGMGLFAVALVVVTYLAAFTATALVASWHSSGSTALPRG